MYLSRCCRKNKKAAEENLSQLIENRLFKYIGIDCDADTGLYVYANKKSFQEIATETGYCKQVIVNRLLSNGCIEAC